MRTLLAALAALTLATFTAPATAQRRVPEHLVLARVCVHEAGWSSPDDCAAIWAVLRAGAERHDMRTTTFARAYSGRALRGETARSWVAELDERGSTPRSWPRVWVDGDGRVRRHPSFAVFRERWLALLEVCRSIVAGETPSSCEVEPHDWGGPCDDERAERLRLIRIDCGETVNRFYLRPSLAEARLDEGDGETPDGA